MCLSSKSNTYSETTSALLAHEQPLAKREKQRDRLIPPQKTGSSAYTSI